jgi:hypothetical protein
VLVESEGRLVAYQRTQRAAGESGGATLAVLPFKPIVLNQRDEVLEMGMADSLIAKLGSLRAVRTRPLGAVRTYNGATQDPLAAGRWVSISSSTAPCNETATAFASPHGCYVCMTVWRDGQTSSTRN